MSGQHKQESFEKKFPSLKWKLETHMVWEEFEQKEKPNLMLYLKDVEEHCLDKTKFKEDIGKLREDYENWKGNGDKGISDMSSEGYEFDVLDLIEKRLGL
jgi:hypothetical protein